MKLSLKDGITSFELKILGIILMTFDHLGAFLVLQTPVWFGWLGRPVATIFLFTSALGYHYTKNKKKYLLRLLIGFWIMNLFNFMFSKFLPVEGVELYANIFGTIFLGVLAMYLYDIVKNSIKSKTYKNIIFVIIFVVGLFALSFMIPTLMSVNLTLGALIFNIIPTPLFVEGGVVYIVMALLFYIFIDNKKAQMLVILLFSALFLASGLSAGNIFTSNYQWMAVFSIIPIYLYNGEKGKSLKYFFYVYYISHIMVIYLASYFISK